METGALDLSLMSMVSTDEAIAETVFRMDWLQGSPKIHSRYDNGSHPPGSLVFDYETNTVLWMSQGWLTG